ncbi:MAG: mandelate racemase/muconate lactonizing enzyme family protein [Gammaproteobacteria bacterium]|nr:mandelate racemase/muconate lactonizing enzyme family protein [Gammaproteobacteria bacterium]
MKISGHEVLHCDAGWRNFSFLRIDTDEGLSGISEFNESYGSHGVSAVVAHLMGSIEGEDPRPHEKLSTQLYAMTRQAPGGINQQAIAAIENALLDLKGKALGVPVYELLGGPIRDRLRLYWSHCGTYRFGPASEYLDHPAIETLEDLEALGKEVHQRGFTGLKTNIFMFDEGAPQLHMPGFGRTAGGPELNSTKRVIDALREQLSALRAGAGANMDILLDLNFNFKTEGYLRVTRALDDLGLFWYEIDTYDPASLNHIRRSVNTPIASCESLYGLREFKPFFEHYAMDVAIVDVPWNGIWQSMKIAGMAEAYEVNCAPHNFYGHLCTMQSAHFCAAIPNFRVMEIDIDDVSWKDDLVTVVPQIEDGYMTIPTGPGWGTELNEDAIRAHPPRQGKRNH